MRLKEWNIKHARRLGAGPLMRMASWIEPNVRWKQQRREKTDNRDRMNVSTDGHADHTAEQIALHLLPRFVHRDTEMKCNMVCFPPLFTHNYIIIFPLDVAFPCKVLFWCLQPTLDCTSALSCGWVSVTLIINPHWQFISLPHLEKNSAQRYRLPGSETQSWFALRVDASLEHTGVENH